MYWVSKRHTKPLGIDFIITFKRCSTKQISKFLSNVFKIVYFQMENVHKNAKFLKIYDKFCVLLNSDPMIHSLKNIKKVWQIHCNMRLFDITQKATWWSINNHLLLDYLSLMQHIGGRKQNEYLILVKHYLNSYTSAILKLEMC